MSKSISTVKIAFAYVGTVVGAGFATGKEVFVFFTKHDIWGNLGISIAIFLFIWLGYRMMLMGNRLEASSYEELNTYLFGSKFGKLLTIFVSITLFCVTTAMLSGMGTIFSDNLGIPIFISNILVALLTYKIVSKKMQGILMINLYVVPLMIFFTVLISCFSIYSSDIIVSNIKSQNFDFPAIVIWDALRYVGINLVMAQAVLVPLGVSAKDKKSIFRGSLLGGGILGLLLLLSQQALWIYYDDIHASNMPMAHIISFLHPLLYNLFLIVIAAEILTTLVGNLYGLVIRQVKNNQQNFLKVNIIILGLAYLFSLFGFSNIVEHIYPLLGGLSLLSILFLSFRKIPALNKSPSPLLFRETYPKLKEYKEG